MFIINSNMPPEIQKPRIARSPETGGGSGGGDAGPKKPAGAVDYFEFHRKIVRENPRVREEMKKRGLPIDDNDHQRSSTESNTRSSVSKPPKP
jgi:hypothetical protein